MARPRYLFINVPPGLNREVHDFFDYNPELRYFDCINRLVKEVGAKRASELMWAVYLVLDPDSKFFSQPLDRRRAQVAEHFLGDAGFDWDSVDYVLACYPDISMSPAKSDYFRVRTLFNKLLDSATDFSDKKIESFLSNLQKMYSGLDKVEVRMVKEREAEAAVQIRGTQEPGKYAKGKH